VVVKYADNVLKGFATSVSIIVSCIVFLIIYAIYSKFSGKKGTWANNIPTELKKYEEGENEEDEQHIDIKFVVEVERLARLASENI
jgi:hypothetical protein